MERRSRRSRGLTFAAAATGTAALGGAVALGLVARIGGDLPVASVFAGGAGGRVASGVARDFKTAEAVGDAEHTPEAVRMIHDSDRGELVIEIGPADLPAAGHAGHGEPGADAARGQRGEHEAGAGHGRGVEPHSVESYGTHNPVFPPVGTLRFPISAWLSGFRYEVVDGKGRAVPFEVLHHLNLIDPDHRELFVPISRRILAVSKETGTQSVPGFLLGFPVAAGQPMVVATMLHNPTGRDYEDVVVRVRLQYVKPGRPWPLFAVYPFQLDVAFPAGDKSFHLPPGRSERSYEASPVVPGRILAISGHVHEYAVSLRFEDATERRLIWEAGPILDEESRVVGMPVGQLYRRLGVAIRPDHRYRVTVVYENPTGDTIRDGGMGVVAGVLRSAPNVKWPAADPADPLYQLDRGHYMREIRGTFAEISRHE